MPRRLDKTLADYVGIAISPVLIMAMVGSLVFFLLEVFYQGDYEVRLQVILALFVMATVLIGRISIEQSTEQAALYALALGSVTAFAIWRLVDHGWLFNVSLLGVIWWSAHKLTWDCTLIDETADSSGEGLLQITGLDLRKNAGASPKAAEAEQEPKSEPKQDAETAAEEAAKENKEKPKQPKPDKRKPHAPGVWIVYFSMAALPLFGLGEIFLRNHPEQKHHAFFLLLIYVASGLGLLLTTSFLGLRRYLRQRQLQMPVAMAGSWIGLGAVLVVVLLVLTALLPRPGMDQSPFQLPIVLRSPEQKASRLAVGNDGAKGPGKPGAAQQAPDQQSAQAQPGGKGPPQQSSQGGGQQPGNSGQQSGNQKSGGQQSDQKSGPQSGNQRSSSSSGPQQNQKQESSSPSGSSSQESQGQRSQDQRPKEPDSKSSSPASQDKPQGSSGGDSRQTKSSESFEPSKSSESSNQSSSPSSSPPWKMPEISVGLNHEWLLATFRWVLYLAVAIVGLVWLWRCRGELPRFLRGLFQALGNLWGLLFGRRKPKAKEEAVAEAPRAQPRPFAAYGDPFANGMAAQCTPEELVRYTFEALEAWGREQGCLRPADQTVFEFVRCVAGRAPALAGSTRQLAELYNQAAYAPGTLQAAQVVALRQLWQLMQSTAAPAYDSPPTPGASSPS